MQIKLTYDHNQHDSQMQEPRFVHSGFPEGYAVPAPLVAPLKEYVKSEHYCLPKSSFMKKLYNIV